MKGLTKMKVEKKRFVDIILCVFLLLFFYIITFFGGSDSENLRFLIGVSVCIFFFCTYALYQYFGTFNNLFIWYYIIFYIFSNGQYLLLLFNVPMGELAGLRWLQLSPQIRVDALLFCTGAQICLAVGALIVNPSDYFKRLEIKQIYLNESFRKKIKNLGIIMMIISIPIDLDIQVKRTIQYISLGYSSELEEATSMIGSLALFCLPGCYLTALSQINKNWKSKYLPLLYIVIRSVLMLLAGKRGQSLGCLCAVLWYIVATMPKINHKRNKVFTIVKYAIVAYFFLVIIDTIRAVRDIENRSLVMVFNQFIESFVSPTLIKDFFNELGGSIRPLVVNMQYMQSGVLTHVYGASFLAPIIMIIPNFLRFGLYEKFSSYGWLEIERTLSKKVNAGYGIGYSLNAEMYYNFGKYGFLFALLIGYVFSKFLTVTGKDNKNKEVLWYAFIPTFFSLIIITTRGSFQLVYKYIVWYILLPYILVMSGENVE